mmetsp:Transcript_6167/g.11253  ORF Transcript_6167/g.11253 Transcript_6167/m.11253 type:complete len:87 (+) Transcript_6167:1378-1638(+)
MSKPEEQVECVGSLLVHSTDVKELSDAPLGNHGDAKNTIECVGTLVVNSNEVEELSEPTQSSPSVNLKKRATAVGTLLVSVDDESK